jgi:hypothetical protein
MVSRLSGSKGDQSWGWAVGLETCTLQPSRDCKRVGKTRNSPGSDSRLVWSLDTKGRHDVETSSLSSKEVPNRVSAILQPNLVQPSGMDSTNCQHTLHEASVVVSWKSLLGTRDASRK